MSLYQHQAVWQDNEKRMTRTTLQKSGLTDIHVKMRVEWDRVTCEPLEKNGQFV